LGLERWFIGHACEIGVTPGVSVPGYAKRQLITSGWKLRQLNSGMPGWKSWRKRLLPSMLPSHVYVKLQEITVTTVKWEDSREH